MDGTADGAREGGEAAAEATGNQRREARKAFLKRAQIVFGGAGVDCIVENMSNAGARVRFGNPIALPDVIALRFNDGTSHPARRRWALGEMAGLEFSGAGPAADTERRDLARSVRDAVAAADPAEALRGLRYAWFLGDEELRRAAAALEMAHVRFMGAIAAHVGRPPVVVVPRSDDDEG